jgi:hypothetical protein
VLFPQLAEVISLTQAKRDVHVIQGSLDWPAGRPSLGHPSWSQVPTVVEGREAMEVLAQKEDPVVRSRARPYRLSAFQ